MLGSALLVASASAAGFALSTSLQHRAAGRAPATTDGTHRLLAHLAGRPWWVVGQLVAIVSFGLHALALHMGTIVVVQPVVVSGIVLAVPVRAALARRLPALSELGTVALTATGLALFLAAARPSAGHSSTNPWTSAGLTGAGVLAAIAATWWAGRCASKERAAMWFGVASGLLFGLVAGLVKLTTTATGAAGAPSWMPWWAFLGLWSTWAVLVTGLTGVALNQRAYRIARLSASMPVLNIVDVLVALLFGVAVFGEIPAHGALDLAAETAAAVCVTLGLRRLSRSDVFAEPPDPAVQTGPNGEANREPADASRTRAQGSMQGPSQGRSEGPSSDIAPIHSSRRTR